MSRIDTGNQGQTKTQDKLTETPAGESLIRPAVKGKFLYVGDEKFFVRGVTCGTYRPDENGSEYNKAVVEHDLRRIAQNGLNSIRTYTVPPQWLLDAASQHGLRVLVGLPWEQHITFLDEPRRFRDIERRVAEGVRACSGHPAVLGYAIGSEIPASIVRWHGRVKIQRCIERLHQAAKAQDPDGLVTYVNYPSTEYLELPF
ncbi:MAG: glycosyl transferase, partial [Acidobacteria bacterium]